MRATDGTTPTTARAVLTRLIYDIVVGIYKKESDEKVISILILYKNTTQRDLLPASSLHVDLLPCLLFRVYNTKACHQLIHWLDPYSRSIYVY